MAVTFKLKPDMQWADGTPVTARDLAFTWKVARDPNAGFSNAYDWRRASSVDVVDDHTAVLHLDHALVSYQQWDQILPEHIEGPVYEKGQKAGDYINTTTFNRDPTNPGLWDGPYRITQYTVGSQIVMEPNPHWAGTKPGFKRIVLRFIGDTAALQANLLSGDVDLDNNITIDQALTLRDKYPDRFAYTFSPSLTYAHIDLQKDNPILQDVRVRRALLMGIDRPTINKRLFGGMQTPIASFVGPQNPNYDASLQPVPYDPAGAKKLLAEAGWTPGPDGICRDKDGHKLSLDFLSAAGFKLNELEMTVMQSEWKQACIETNLRFEPSRTLFGTTTKHRCFPGMVMYTWTSARGRKPARDAGRGPGPDRGEQLGRREFPRLRQSALRCGRAHVGNRARSGEEQGGLVRHAAHLCRCAAGAAALHQRHPASRAEMAERLRPERHRAALHAAGGAVARRVGAIYFPGACRRDDGDARDIAHAAPAALVARHDDAEVIRPEPLPVHALGKDDLLVLELG